MLSGVESQLAIGWVTGAGVHVHLVDVNVRVFRFFCMQVRFKHLLERRGQAATIVPRMQVIEGTGAAYNLMLVDQLDLGDATHRLVAIALDSCIHVLI